MPTTLSKKPVLARDIKCCPGCGEKVYSHGRCKTHYEHIRRWIRTDKLARVRGGAMLPLTTPLAIRLGYLAPPCHDEKRRVLVLVPDQPAPDQAPSCPHCGKSVYSRGRCKGRFSSVRRRIQLRRLVKYRGRLRPLTDSIAVDLGMLDAVKDKSKDLTPVFKLVRP